MDAGAANGRTVFRISCIVDRFLMGWNLTISAELDAASTQIIYKRSRAEKMSYAESRRLLMPPPETCVLMGMITRPRIRGLLATVRVSAALV